MEDSSLPFNPDAPASPGAGIFGLETQPSEAKVVLIPVPFEATTSYRGGTSNGPQAILQASHQIDLFDIETGHPYREGIAMIEEPSIVREWNELAKKLAKPLIEAGGIVRTPEEKTSQKKVNELCSQMNDWVYEEVKVWRKQHKLIGIVGGDHSVPFGSILAHAEDAKPFGILHLDAHADLRNAYESFLWSHASIMYNVMQKIPAVEVLVQVGLRDLGFAEYQMIQSNEKIYSFFDANIAQKRLSGIFWTQQIQEIIKTLPERVYLSFDIDGLDPALCPNTGTPVPGGLSFHEVCVLLSELVASGRMIIGFDLVEVSPGESFLPGSSEEWDANVGARLLYKMIGFALKSQIRPPL